MLWSWHQIANDFREHIFLSVHCPFSWKSNSFLPPLEIVLGALLWNMHQMPAQYNWSCRSVAWMLNIWLWLHWFLFWKTVLHGHREYVCVRAQNAYWNSSKLFTFFSHTREWGLQLHSVHLLLFGFRCLYPSWKAVLISSKAVQAFPLLCGLHHQSWHSEMARCHQGKKAGAALSRKNNWLD